MKYVDTLITFSEVPNEISLCINISNCPNNCDGCHSPYLRKDIGTELTEDKLNELIKRNNGITCVCLMGGDANPSEINKLGMAIHKAGLKSAWYSGNDKLSNNIDISNFDFIKIGSYKKELGPLNNKNTNQKFFKNINNKLINITQKFQCDE